MEGALTGEPAASAAWLLACLALACLGAPIAAVLLAPLDRYAVAFGLPVALAVLGLVGVWVGHVAIVAGLVAGLGALLAGAVLALRRLESPAELRRGAPALGVFVLAFGLMLGLRALDPAVDPASGEKFLDFGLLRAHLRAVRLPAEDVWFAGEPFSYYYGGQYVAALLARLTGTPARLAYNLTMATFYAATATAAYGLAGGIATRWEAGRSAALLGAFFVGLASNLLTPVRLALGVLPDAVGGALVGLVGYQEYLTPLAPADFHYWGASQFVPGMRAVFPFFAFINGDLHAHMLVWPFALLGIAVLYACFRTSVTRRHARQALAFGALPAVGGVIALTNAWSLPTLLGLTWLTLYFGPSAADLLPRALARRLPIGASEGPLARLLAPTLATGLVAVAAVAWSLPFWLVSPSRGMGIAVVEHPSPAWTLLVAYGLFLLPAVPYLARRVHPVLGQQASAATAAVAVIVVGTGLFDRAGALLFGLLAVLTWAALERARNGRAGLPTGYEAVLLLGAATLVALVEVVYLTEPAAPGRFNTFFKFYADVWILFGIGAAVVVGRYLRHADGPALLGLPTGARRAVPVVLVAGLLVIGGVYPALAIEEWRSTDGPVRATDDPTIDALAFAEERYPEEMAAIEWLDDRQGTPTLLSAPGTDIYDGYRWVNAPSSLTGIPTVAGWAHEIGYRGWDSYWGRVDDVRAAFNESTVPERRRQLLAEYDVRYVYYGPIERERYGPPVFANASYATPAYQNERVTIYRIDSE